MTNLNWIGPVSEQTSYGIVNNNIIHELIKLGINVALFPIDNRNMTCHPKHRDSIQKALENAKMPDFQADSVRLWHQFQMDQFVGNGSHIAFPIFELDQFNEQEKHHTFSQDRILVCSNWAKETLTNIHSKWEHGNYIDLPDIDVVPLGFDPYIFFPAKPNTSKTTRFLNIGKQEKRKGHDVLAEIFNKAFTPQDDVELWMMSDSFFVKDEDKAAFQKSYKDTPMGHKIKFLPRLESPEEVADIMRFVDCGIFPSRAEGWNLPLLEMMACGKICITTHYAAHTEFCRANNSHLVYIDETEPAHDGIWFHGQGNWAKLIDDNISTFTYYMQEVHKYKQLGSPKDPTQKIADSVNQFTWENSAKKIIEVLNL